MGTIFYTSSIRAGKYDGDFWSGKTKLNLSEGFGAHGVENTNQEILGKYAGKFEGVNVYESANLGNGYRSGGITLPGKGIVVGTNVIKGAKQNAWLLEHEFGHILQAKEVGYLKFYGVIGKESLWSATFYPENHGEFWIETWANQLARKHFGLLSWEVGKYLSEKHLGESLFKEPLGFWNWFKLKMYPN